MRKMSISLFSPVLTELRCVNSVCEESGPLTHFVYSNAQIHIEIHIQIPLQHTKMRRKNYITLVMYYECEMKAII